MKDTVDEMGEEIMDRPYLKELETKVECLRAQIHKQVGSDDKKLSDPLILSLSKELDGLIVEYMKIAKNKEQL